MRLHSLTSRFLLTLLLSTTLPFMAIGWYALGEMRKGLEQQVAEIYLPRWADNAGQRVSDRLMGIRQVCDLLVVPARKLLSGGEPEDFEDHLVHTFGLLEGYVDLVLLADRTGKVVFHKEGNQLPAGSRASRADLIPKTVVEEDWFRDLNLWDKELVWIPWARSPYMHRDTAYITKNPSDYHVGLAREIGGREWGALLVLIRWQEIQAVLDDQRTWLQEEANFPSAEVFLIASGGTVLAHTDREKYGTELQPTEFLGDMLFKGGGDGRFIDEENRARRAGFAKVSDERGRQWWLGLHVTEDEIFATSVTFAQGLVLAIGIAMAILTVWSLVASRAILRPVRSLVSATGAVAKGDLAVRVPARGKHELADLGRAFNAMAEDLSVSREQLKHGERQAAWAEMARQVAHEIKNPLTPMRMSAQMLLKAQKENGSRVEELTSRLARTVMEQTDALDRIASDFRQFAGSPTRELGPCSVDQLLEGVEEGFGAMAEGSGVKLVVRPGARGAVVRVDEHEFRRVFLNLLHNALAACGGGGEVELTSDLEGTKVVFRVADSGPGVPDELREKLFEPYFTTKSSGTGLGLAICRRIVEAHGGLIELESSRPGRTVFRLELPLAKS